jgi:uncharacterized RDD family membrane protein YckC
VSPRVRQRPIEGRQGHYAGGASRLGAFLADLAISWGLYAAAFLVIGLLASLITGTTLRIHDFRWVSAITIVVWEFVYFSYQWALGGRTLGMALFGVRVVNADGSTTGTKGAVIRTLVLPVSIAVLGLGLIGIFVQREHRAWHDLAAGTCVVYSWDARAATLRWLVRRHQADVLGASVISGAPAGAGVPLHDEPAREEPAREEPVTSGS